jgi:hypothetical protein
MAPPVEVLAAHKNKLRAIWDGDQAEGRVFAVRRWRAVAGSQFT